MTAYHLAQLNCAVPRYEKTDPRFAGFVDHLDEINGLGDASPGWVWRLKDDGNDAMAMRWLTPQDICLISRFGKALRRCINLFTAASTQTSSSAAMSGLKRSPNPQQCFGGCR